MTIRQRRNIDIFIKILHSFVVLNWKKNKIRLVLLIGRTQKTVTHFPHITSNRFIIVTLRDAPHWKSQNVLWNNIPNIGFEELAKQWKYIFNMNFHTKTLCALIFFSIRIRNDITCEYFVCECQEILITKKANRENFELRLATIETMSTTTMNERNWNRSDC